jgi:transglutaminase-like putative cysteine protease
MSVPDYSFNTGAPSDVAGWPEYAGWRQRIISFSGVQPDATLELDYEIVTRAGVLPWVSADLRLDDDYPIVERVVTVTLPHEEIRLWHRTDSMHGKTATLSEQVDRGMKTYKWVIAPPALPGTPAEPQSPLWTHRCPRLRFTTVYGAETWINTQFNAIDQAAKADDTVQAFVKKAIENETDPAEQVRKIADKFRARFNYVGSPKTWRSCACRDAGTVLQSNYGNPLEAAAVCLAALRSLGIEARVETMVDPDYWFKSVPTDTAMMGMAVIAQINGEPLYVDPHRGVFSNPTGKGKRILLGFDNQAELRETYIHERGQLEPSEIRLTGELTVDEKGAATGEIRVRLTGGFYDPLNLDTAGRQESFLTALLSRVVSDVKVTSHSIQTLSADTLTATMKVASEGPLTNAGKDFVLELGKGPACLSEFPLPLERSYRSMDVQVKGRAREIVDLRIELPEGWTAHVTPREYPATTGKWGSVEQSLNVDEDGIRLQRRISIEAERIPAAQFEPLREAMNHLRADGNLCVLLGP